MVYDSINEEFMATDQNVSILSNEKVARTHQPEESLTVASAAPKEVCEKLATKFFSYRSGQEKNATLDFE